MPPKTPSQSTDIQRLILISLVVVGAAVVVFLLVRRPANSPTVTSVHQARIAAVTPQAYTSISGSITALNPATKSMTTNFSYIDPQGQNQEKKYTVTVNDATVMQSIDQTVSPASVATIDFSKFAVGDKVDIIANDNLAPIDAFTATTILQYHR